MPIPTIETENLILRPFTVEDADAYYAAVLGDPTVMRRAPTGVTVPGPRAAAIVRGLIDDWAALVFGLWGVPVRADGRLIGHCGLRPLDRKPDQVELTCLLASGERQHIVEALVATLRWGLRVYGLARIAAVPQSTDRAWRAALEAAGLRFQRMIHAYNEHLPYYVIEQGDFQIDPAQHWVMKP